MANAKQLKILKQGIKVWNIWRDENPSVKIDLRRADLSMAALNGADLTGADLREANFVRSLTNAELKNANLKEPSIYLAGLMGTNFRNANLSGADFSKTYLIETNLTGAILSGTNFTKAHLWFTIFGDNDLSNSIGLNTLKHHSPSIIGTGTIHKSKGKMPIEFLRGCGLDNLDIEYAKLASPNLDSEQILQVTNEIHRMCCNQPIQFYSCFISYNSKDQDFTERLYDDLQNNGVRCWFAAEDLKIGDEFRKSIGHQIRLRDKLLIILSQNSIQSEWVGDEVEKALAEEKEQGALKLFPIRLDDAIFNAKDDWAEKIRLRRHIGDFSSDYNKGLEKLLHDLKVQ